MSIVFLLNFKIWKLAISIENLVLYVDHYSLVYDLIFAIIRLFYTFLAAIRRKN